MPCIVVDRCAIMNRIWFLFGILDLIYFNKIQKMKISNFPNGLISREISGIPSGMPYISRHFRRFIDQMLCNDSMKAEIIVTSIRLRSYSIWREVMVLRDGLIFSQTKFLTFQVYQFSLILGLKLVYPILIS